MATNQTGKAQPADRFHMRTVNGGTPERIETRKALAEINNAMMLPGKKAVRTMSAIGSRARIEYRDNRGVVELRPATAQENADWKPEAEQYAPGDTVIVRPEVYNPTARKYRILPEYAGTVVNWTGTHYNVRAANPDQHGPDGVRPCRPRELRPDPRVTGTAPWFTNNQDVTAALAVLKAAGHTLGSLALRTGGANIDGAFVTPEGGQGNTGSRVSYLANGWAEESATARRNAQRRTEERTARNKALDAYAATLRAAGWKVYHVASSNTQTRRVLHLLVWPPATAEEKAANILGPGAKWIRHDFTPGQGAPCRTVFRESALNLITEHLNAGAKVYPSTEGGVKIEPTDAKTSYWLQPFPATR
ncbi:hypothetical protein [Streptomyces glaucus]|uniref:Uncharacterized protein n=1 Tax=Streptomyces glaucus TaxID=284029 RepID=A0ABN3JSV0_9ACTN